MESMFPRAVSCSQCRHTAIVVAWVPMTKVSNEANGTDNFKTGEISCRIDCSICGRRIQRVEFRIASVEAAGFRSVARVHVAWKAGRHCAKTRAGRA